MDQLIFDGAIGDTIGITPLIEIFHKVGGSKINVFTQFPEIFEHNPFVQNSYKIDNSTPRTVDPCRVYKCHAIEHYMRQLGLPYDKTVMPKIYVSDEEVQLAKAELESFNGFKKIAVCLNTAADSKSLRYDYIKQLLIRLKRENYKIILFGTRWIDDTDNIFDKFVIGQQYGVGLRKPIALLNECDLYIGIDAGIYHMAAALGKPQFTFFRNNESKINSYINTTFIDSDLYCSTECLQPYTEDCKSNRRCMDYFNLNKCYDAIKTLV